MGVVVIDHARASTRRRLISDSVLERLGTAGALHLRRSAVVVSIELLDITRSWHVTCRVDGCVQLAGLAWTHGNSADTECPAYRLYCAFYATELVAW